jgi:hypothetical protein
MKTSKDLSAFCRQGDAAGQKIYQAFVDAGLMKMTIQKLKH